MLLCISIVDDILIIDNNYEMIQTTKKILTSKFDVKDLGVAGVDYRN